MTKLIDLESIGPVYAEKLKKAGVRSVEALLKQGSTAKGRKELEAATDIGHKLILEWVNHADLYRIKGVASEYADLLEEAGVDTVVELATRNPENLYKAILDVNVQKNLVNRAATLKMVKNWVEQAKLLPRIVEY